MMKFDVILADPPWEFKPRGRSIGGRTPQEHYPVMTMEDLKQLGPAVEKVSARNCTLFLWGTWRSLPDCLRVINWWGFTYRTEAWVWVKMIKDGSRPAIGTGYYTRNVSEYCLMGVRGKMPVDDRGIPAAILSPRREYSVKPWEQYAMIEALYPGTHKLELFATKQQSGWTSLGLSIDERDIREALADVADQSDG